MKLCDAISMLARAKAHMSHVEAVWIGLLTKLKCLLNWNTNAQLLIFWLTVTEVAAHHLHVEAVDACWDWGVGGEDVGRTNLLECCWVLHALCDALADTLEG